MNKQRIAAVIIAGVGLLAFFLPWASIPIYGSTSGVDGQRSWVIFGAFLLCLILPLVGERKKALNTGAMITIAVAGLIAVVLSLLQIGDTMSANTDLVRVNVGIGLYLEVICGVGVALVAILKSLFEPKK